MARTVVLPLIGLAALSGKKGGAGVAAAKRPGPAMSAARRRGIG
jgi:hypothetical protein